MLYDEIKKKNIEAMKARDSVARAIYSVLISKIDLIRINKRENGEELTDVDCINVIQKTLKELDDEQSNFIKVNNIEKVESIEKQKEYAKSFLPKMLTESEVRDIISNLDDKTIPAIMKYFKSNYAGKCDMSIVNRVGKEFN